MVAGAGAVAGAMGAGEAGVSVDGEAESVPAVVVVVASWVLLVSAAVVGLEGVVVCALGVPRTLRDSP